MTIIDRTLTTEEIVDLADEELSEARSKALKRFGHVLLANGADIDSEEFRQQMLEHALELREWRSGALAKVREFIAAKTLN